MATLSFSWEVTAANKARIIEGISGQHDYPDEVSDPDNPLELIPNPETKAQYAKRMAKRWVMENVKAFEADLAANTARDAAIEAVEDEVILT